MNVRQVSMAGLCFILLPMLAGAQQRNALPQAVDSEGAALETLGIEQVAGRPLMIFKDQKEGQYYFLQLAGEEKAMAQWPALDGLLVDGKFGELGLLNLQFGEGNSVKAAQIWNGKEWSEVKSAGDIAVTASRPFPPFTVVPGNPPTRPCQGGWIYQGSYWSGGSPSGGCLVDVYKCATTQDTIMSIACCFSDTPGEGGPDCESFGLS
jgi:hypothetical protein